jgi:hypothetical protein
MKLTKSQREKLAAGEPVKIAGEGECPVAPGDTIPVLTGVELIVTGIRTPKGGGWSLRYTLTRADVALFLKRRPSIPANDFKRVRAGFDSAGAPGTSTPAAIKAAALESAYSHVGDPLDAGQIVHPDEVAEINERRRKLQNLWAQERRVIESSLNRLTVDPETRLAAAREIRALQRQLDALDRKLKSAA